MVPEYKLYHGAVLAELIDIADCDITIGEMKEDGRLSSYTLNNSIGLHVKHSTARLAPWQFTITKANLSEWAKLTETFRQVYIVLVCHLDGIVALSISEIAIVIEAGVSQQAWVRVDRSRGQWYKVSGSGGNLPYKKSKGLSSIIKDLGSN